MLDKRIKQIAVDFIIKNGDKKQLLKAVEEINELIAALKLYDTEEFDIENTIEEIFDVEVMLYQVYKILKVERVTLEYKYQAPTSAIFITIFIEDLRKLANELNNIETDHFNKMRFAIRYESVISKLDSLKEILNINDQEILAAGIAKFKKREWY